MVLLCFEDGVLLGTSNVGDCVVCFRWCGGLGFDCSVVVCG